MAVTKIAKVSRQAQLQKILSGISARFSGVTTVTFGGKAVVLADFVKLVQTELDGIAASAKAKDAYAAEVQTERNARTQLNPALRQFRNLVFATFGDTQDSVQALGDFGLAPRKVGKKTAEVKAEAAKKAEATRKAREGGSTETATTPAVTPAPVSTPPAKG
jgi:hypothetical protein